MAPSTSAEIQALEEKVASLIDDLQEEISEISSSSLSPEFCIYRLPHDIHQLNEKVYTPKYISIGPLHFLANDTLRVTQRLKMKYFKIFLEKAPPEVDVGYTVRTISDMLGKIKRRYPEPIELDDHAFLRMIVLDASFIIVFFLISFNPTEWAEYHDEFTLIKSQSMDDFLLLENQLPFFIIEDIYNFAFSTRSDESYHVYPSFIELTYKFFVDYNSQMIDHDSNLKIMHFVDLLRIFFLPPLAGLPQRNKGERVMHLYTASQLHYAGVKFKVSSSRCLFDLKFLHGVLEIPCFQVNYSTECFFRNIMALEHFYYHFGSYVSDYIRILNFLIDSTKDVDLLVHEKILINNLGDSKAVATMVNNCNKCTLLVNTNSDYFRLCEDLNTFYEDPRHSWKTTLRREYFSNPWKTIFIVATFIVVGLTIIQTAYSIKSAQKN